MVQFPSAVLHARCSLLNSSALPCESGLGFSGRCSRNKVTNSSWSSNLIREIFQVMMWLQKNRRTSDGNDFVSSLRFFSLFMMLTKIIIPTFLVFLKEEGLLGHLEENLVERYKNVCSCNSATTPSWKS